MKASIFRAALLAACLPLVGCVGTDGVRPCDLWTSSALIAGHVSDSSGSAVVGATIEVQVMVCDQTDSNRASRVATDTNGNYLADVKLGNARGIRCISVAEMGSGTSASGEVEFVGGCEDKRSPHPLHLDLVIP